MDLKEQTTQTDVKIGVEYENMKRLAKENRSLKSKIRQIMSHLEYLEVQIRLFNDLMACNKSGPSSETEKDQIRLQIENSYFRAEILSSKENERRLETMVADLRTKLSKSLREEKNGQMLLAYFEKRLGETEEIMKDKDSPRTISGRREHGSVSYCRNSSKQVKELLTDRS